MCTACRAAPRALALQWCCCVRCCWPPYSRKHVPARPHTHMPARPPARPPARSHARPPARPHARPQAHMHTRTHARELARTRTCVCVCAGSVREEELVRGELDYFVTEARSYAPPHVPMAIEDADSDTKLHFVRGIFNHVNNTYDIISMAINRNQRCRRRTKSLVVNSRQASS